MSTLSTLPLDAWNATADRWAPEQLLGKALALVPDGTVTLASSFSAEDNVLLDIAVRISRRFRVVTLDTGRLPEETYDVMERVRARYGVRVEVFFPRHEAVEGLVGLKGLMSFRASVDERKACCAIRKLEPLSRALSGVTVWAAGLRQAHGPTRAGLQPFERDGEGRLKVSPLWRMTDEQLWKYVKEHDVPVSALYRAGYTSIGCAPCTRPTAPGEDPRSGRWWWEEPEHKECGLHPAHPAVAGRVHA